MPAEMGVALGLVSRKYIDDEIKRLESFDITRIKLLPKTKEIVLNYLDFCQKKPLIFAIGASLAAVLLAVILLIILL